MRNKFHIIAFFAAAGALTGWAAGLILVLDYMLTSLHLWSWSFFMLGVAMQVVLGMLIGIAAGVFACVITLAAGKFRSGAFLTAMAAASIALVLLFSSIFLAVLPDTISITSFKGLLISLVLLISVSTGGFFLWRFLERFPGSFFSKYPPQSLILWGRTILIFLLFVLIVGVGAGLDHILSGLEKKASPPSRLKCPDIILIVLDTLRADHLSCYGYSSKTSPFLDNYATESALYLNAISTSCHTPPPHATLLTGKYPSTHGVYGNNRFMSPRDRRLPGLLAETGYHSVGIVSNLALHAVFGFGMGFDAYISERLDILTHIGFWQKIGLWGGVKRNFPGLVPILSRPEKLENKRMNEAEYTTDLAIEAVGEAPPNRPLFLFLNYMDPHMPYAPPPGDLRYFLKGDQQQGGELSHAGNSSMASKSNKEIMDILFARLNREKANLLPELPREDLDYLLAAYDGEIRYLDRHLARLFDSLKAEGRLDNALVIITSDHGEHFGEHRIFLHANSLYEELIRIPLLISWPGRIAAGPRDQLVSLISLTPTMLEAAGVPIPEDMEGESLLPGLVADGDEIRREEKTVWESSGVVSQWTGNHAIYSEGFKGIFYKSGDVEIYDLSSDPAETQNLAPVRPAIKQRLEDRLSEWKASRGNVDPVDAAAREVAAPLKERLEALGYIN